MAEPVAELQAVELALLELLRESVRPAVMIDVGAHHGLTCEPFLKAGWQVFAFEPIESNRTVMRERLGNYAGLVLREEAVSDVCGVRTLHLAVRSDGQLHDYFHSLETVGDTAEFRYGATRSVPTVTLDALAAQGELPRQVGLLKIDTEGHDLAVLRGAASIEATVVAVEFWCEGLYGGRCPSPAAEMVRLLRQRGYNHFLAVVHQDQRVWRQWSSLEGLGPQAWGNLFFFRDPALAAAVQQRLDTGEVPDPSVGEDKPRWLNLLEAVLPREQSWVFYDVGAYHGDFTALLLQHFPLAEGVAFEPTPHTFRYLQARFAVQGRVRVLPLALSDRPGRLSYYLLDQPYNNSLLPPTDAVARQVIEVETETLDRFRQQQAQPVRLIKVDAQGHDLHILRGASGTLQQDRPIVWVEATFLPMYAGQDDPIELLAFLHQHGYRLGGWFNTHSTPQGMLAYTDCLFLPVEVHQRLMPASRLDRYVCDDPHTVQQQNAILQKACQERLELIERLAAECAAHEKAIAALQQPSIRRAVRMMAKAALRGWGRPGERLLAVLTRRLLSVLHKRN